MRVKVKITDRNAVCEESSATTTGVFDLEFGFDSPEWSCSHLHDHAVPTVDLLVGTKQPKTHAPISSLTPPPRIQALKMHTPIDGEEPDRVVIDEEAARMRMHMIEELDADQVRLRAYVCTLVRDACMWMRCVRAHGLPAVRGGCLRVFNV